MGDSGGFSLFFALFNATIDVFNVALSVISFLRLIFWIGGRPLTAGLNTSFDVDVDVDVDVSFYSLRPYVRRTFLS